MENLTSAISVQVDTRDKEIANDILKSQGLNMSTFVNMAIKQLLYTNGLPFEVKNPVDDNIITENINTTSNISNKIKEKSVKTYNNINTMPNLVEFMNNN